MINEKINIAIAEACGWTDCEHIESLGLCKGKHKDVRNQYDSGHSELPDYCNDLNAMHQAEKILNYGQYFRYINELCTLTIADNNSMYLATAAQRAEAFLKTIGKWRFRVGRVTPTALAAWKEARGGCR